MELCPDKNSSIIEIGAGFGVLGYYLDKAGYHDYTIIDIARTNACQTYFLSKNLLDRNIILSGDVENPFDLKYYSADFVFNPLELKLRKAIEDKIFLKEEMLIDFATELMQEDSISEL
jgi:hypothetical protein